MKVKTILFSLLFVVGLLVASCGASSKTCPAYAMDTCDNLVEADS